jgi:hypothetical protein
VKAPYIEKFHFFLKQPHVAQRLKEHSIINPWIIEGYDIDSIETMRNSPLHHFFENTDITTFFSPRDEKIHITFSPKYSVFVLYILFIRLGDPYFFWTNLQIGKETFNNDLNMQNADWFISHIWAILENRNKLVITPSSKADFEYAQSVLFFPVTPDFEDSFFLTKELERWQRISDLEKLFLSKNE